MDYCDNKALFPYIYHLNILFIEILEHNNLIPYLNTYYLIHLLCLLQH